MECKDSEARLLYAFEQGFDFTEEEIKAAKAEIPDEELEIVAGGCDDNYCDHLLRQLGLKYCLAWILFFSI